METNTLSRVFPLTHFSMYNRESREIRCHLFYPCCNYPGSNQLLAVLNCTQSWPRSREPPFSHPIDHSHQERLPRTYLIRTHTLPFHHPFKHVLESKSKNSINTNSLLSQPPPPPNPLNQLQHGRSNHPPASFISSQHPSIISLQRIPFSPLLPQLNSHQPLYPRHHRVPPHYSRSQLSRP